MFRFFFLLCFAAFATSAYSQEWIEMAATDTDTYSAKAGSFEIGQNKAGEAIAVIVGSTFSKARKTYSYGKWYVTAKDCQRGMGKLVVLTTTGAYDFETDFVSAGNSAGAGIADTICTLYSASLKVREGKGM